MVYDGATHHVELKIGAIVHAELLRIKNRFGLAELGTMRFTIENGDNADLVDLPADTLVSSVFVENDVLNITDKVRNLVFSIERFTSTQNYIPSECACYCDLQWGYPRRLSDERRNRTCSFTWH